MQSDAPMYYDFSNGGWEWVCLAHDNRTRLTMEYRKETSPELPYYAVERAEYYRFCRVHMRRLRADADGKREYSAEDVCEVVEEFYHPSEFLYRDSSFETIMEGIGNSMDHMAREILALRERVEELQKVAKSA